MPFTCEVCGKNDLKTEASMKCHKTKMHGNDKGFPARGSTPESSFTCEVCGKNDFKTEASLKCHKTKMHGNDKGFPARGATPQGEFKCEVCGKNDFKTEASMKCHKTKMHDNDQRFPARGAAPEGSFTCEVCGKNDFMTEASMKGHKTKMHGNDKGFPARGATPEGEFTCEICGKNDFVTEASMKGHKTRLHGKVIVEQVAIPSKEVMKENCIRVKSENPTASGSLCEATPSLHKNPHTISSGDQQTILSPPTPRLNNPGGYLSQRMESARLRLEDINKAAYIVRDFIEGERGFRKRLNENGGGFRWDILTSGSYYDKTKNMNPDEFDFMISPMQFDAYMEWNKDMPKGFCKIGLRNTNQSELMTGQYLDPVKFKHMAFKLFGDAANRRLVTRKEKDMDSPAFTILYNPGSKQPEIDIDLVPSIEIKGWPRLACCRSVNPTWVHNDDFCRKCMERYHVVAKSCPDTDYPEDERKLLWRMSFSAAEKYLILHANRGNDKSIRKPIFRFLKTLLEETKGENKGKIKKLCSYHLKMFMLHQFDSWPNDSDDASHKRDSCIHILQQLNTILEQNPTKGFPRINNYFLKGDNVIRHVPKHETELFRKTLQSELDKIK